MATHSSLVIAFVQSAVFALMLSNGVSIPLAEMTAVWRKPGLLTRALVSVVFMVPIAFLAVTLLTDFAPSQRAGMALLAACPGAPLTATRSRLVRGSVSYAAGLQLTLTILAVVTTPLLLGFTYSVLDLGGQLEASAWKVAGQVGVVSLLPVTLGVLMQGIAPGFARRIAKPLRLLSSAMFALLVILVLVPALRLTRSLGATTILGIVAAAAMTLLIGHFMGLGADLRTRASVATAALARNLGLAIFIATTNDYLGLVLPTLAAYTIIGALVVLPYALWVRHELKGSPVPL